MTSKATPRRRAAAFRGAIGHAKLLLLLQRQPCTVGELKRKTGASDGAVRRFFSGWLALGRVRISGMQKSNYNTAPVPVFAYGPGACAGVMTFTSSRPTADMIALDHMFRALEDHPCTEHDLVEVSGFNISTVHKVVLLLLQKHKLHIGAWDRTVNHIRIPAYRYGPGRNATKPRREPKRDINLRHWHRQKAKRHQQQVTEALKGAPQ